MVALARRRRAGAAVVRSCGARDAGALVLPAVAAVGGGAGRQRIDPAVLRGSADDPIPGIGARLRKTLDRFETAREAVNATEGRWRQVFFGDEGTELYRLVAIEAARRDRRNAYNTTRRHFSYLRRRRRIAPVRWDVPDPDEVETDYGAWLADPEAAFAPSSPFPEVFESQRVPGPVGAEYWLRFRSPSPVMNDDVFARVYEPAGVADPPTLVFGHGICVEFDHWHGLVDEVFLMCQMGIRVVRPEAPWHGRRVPDGRYGGEMFIARARAAPSHVPPNHSAKAVLID